MDQKSKVLFLCTGNSCRSQMAEGFARTLMSRTLEAYSAGIIRKGLDPLAVQVMSEVGIDISGYKSKLINELPTQDFDYVITLCTQAQGVCPSFPGKAKIVHHAFDDPPSLAKNVASKEKALPVYRRVRDEVREFVMAMPGNLPDSDTVPFPSFRLDLA